MHSSSRKHSLLIVIFLYTSIVCCWFFYQPGLSGIFLLDDIPNLEKLGALGPIHTWNQFQTFLHSGNSGPTGRPISLTSFLLNANDWPADPYSFKRTNLLIHILSGVLLFGMTRTLLRAIRTDKEQMNDWIAVLSATLWLLNPFLVSTTLYVIQRMTQLETVFVILGIWGYIQGRSRLSDHTMHGYVLISASLIIFTLLATFSKENGALLPTLVLVIELSLGKHWRFLSPGRLWKILFLWAPTLFILVYLTIPLSHLQQPIAKRTFNLFERLLTEARILWEYIFNLLIPHIQTHGLYQDAFVISKSISDPWTTLPAVSGIIALAIAGWLARERFPLLALAILFFLAGHLLESTTIPLELYFEHRNYLPAIFFFLPIAGFLFALTSHVRPTVAVLVCAVILSAYGISTWQRATLWGNPFKLTLTWATMNPLSARAQVNLASMLANAGLTDEAYRILKDAQTRIPNSPYLLASILSFDAKNGTLTAREFEEGVKRLSHLPFDIQEISIFKILVDSINRGGSQPELAGIMMQLLHKTRSTTQGKVPDAYASTFYFEGLLASGQGNGAQAYHAFTEYLELTRNMEYGLSILVTLAQDEHYDHLQKMADQVRKLLEQLPEKDLPRNRKNYESLINSVLRAAELHSSQAGKISPDATP